MARNENLPSHSFSIYYRACADSHTQRLHHRLRCITHHHVWVDGKQMFAADGGMNLKVCICIVVGLKKKKEEQKQKAQCSSRLDHPGVKSQSKQRHWP